MRTHLQKDACGLLPNEASRARLLNSPPLPPLMAPVWADFLALHRRRTWDEGGPKPIAWEALHAFQSVQCLRLEPLYLQLLVLLDDLYLCSYAESKK